MIIIEDGRVVQIASDGMILTNGDLLSKIVYLGDGAPEWEEIPDNGQLEPIDAEIVN